MGLFCTVSEKDGDFSPKIANFPTTRVFHAPTFGLSLRSGYRRGGSEKPRIMGLPGQERNMTISLAVWIQHERD